MAEQVAVYPDKVQRAIDDLYLDIEQIKGRAPEARDLEEAKERFPELSLIYDVYSYAISVSVYCKQVKDIVPLLTWLAHRGYKQGAKATTHMGMRARSYSLGKDVSIWQYFVGGENACTFVKVGERQSVQDVFELKCPDGAFNGMEEDDG